MTIRNASGVNLRLMDTLGVHRPMVGVRPTPVEVVREVLGPAPCHDCRELLVYVQDEFGRQVWVDYGKGIETSTTHSCREPETSS